MGTALIKIKIMPESLETSLSEIENKAKKIIEKESKGEAKFEQEPIAFGLKALIAQFALDESKQIDPIQNEIKKIKGVNSAEISDFRRAFG